MTARPDSQGSNGASPTVGVVLIGRNEGERLMRCLESIRGLAETVVYVDSGSTDGSVERAKEKGARIVALETDRPFTAARARNAGFAELARTGAPEFVQFVDGDCELDAGWIPAARDHLIAHPGIAVVCGRRREKYPEASIYNRLCDHEWNTSVGEAKACGGDAMMRTAAFSAVNGFNPGLIAGEEPELCVRLRAAGWKIWRLDREMTLHDAAMTRFGQWWKRSRRGGYAFAMGAALHGRPPERHWVRETRRALVWGAALPLAIVLGVLVFGPWAALLFLAYPLSVVRLARAGGADAWPRALFLTLGKFPEAIGALEYWLHRLTGRAGRLIEYK
ncbi:MAG: glycosyltransferase [Paracoccaceae bacterium]